MNVYLIVRYFDYEGYSEPEFAYFSEKKAEEKLDELNAELRRQGWKSSQYELITIQTED